MNHFRKALAFFITLTLVLFLAILSTSLTPIASADEGNNSSQSLAGSTCPGPNPVLTFRTPPWSNNFPNKVIYHFKLKNCATATGTRNYKLTAALPGGLTGGWNINYGNIVNTQNVINVARGVTASFDATITAPNNATLGDHKMSLVAKWQGGAGNDTLSFKYIVENECVHKTPVLSAVPDTKTGKPGNKVPFLVTLDNKNEGCSAPYPDYKLSVVGGVPAGWKVDFTKPDDSNVVDDTLKDVNDKRDFKVKITSPNGAANKTFTIKAVNTNNATFSDTLNLTYNIESDTTCTVSGDKNPHFTCTNNTCTQVNACGANSGGCTAAGGTCGNVPVCDRNDPNVTITANKTSVKPGGKIAYTVKITNTDQGTCAKRQMSLTKTLPNNWTGDWDPNNSFEFDKGEIRTKTLVVTSSAQAPENTYKVKVHLKKNNDVLVLTKEADFVVAKTAPTCQAPSSNPHFECQNNSCVSVSSCANSTGGCTAAGGTCGNITFTPVLSVTSYGGRTCVDNSIDNPAKLTWTHPSSATTFTVKKGDTSGGPYTNATTTSNFEYTVPAEENGYYVVSANDGPNSNEVFSRIPDVSQCPTPPTCDVPNSNPHFTCESNACVSVSSCAENTGGCTSAGGSCGTTGCQEGENNPYFVCQSNACVAVTDACGVNSEGCSSAGGSCGTTPGTTSLSFVIGLDSIGTTGTSRVALFAQSNKDPQHPQRNFKVEVFDQNNVLVYQTSNIVNYVAGADAANYGKFVGTVNLEDSFPTGFYTIKVSVEGYLAKQFPGTVIITKGQDNNMQLVNLVTGDIDTDNTLSILDYNLLISCSIFAKTDAQKTTCDSNPGFKKLANINDDGIIDQIDYSYFLQDYSIQSGD